MKTMFVIAALSVLMTGCSGRDSSVLSAKDYGEKWPLVADSAKIGCDPKSVAWVEVEGKRYALNGNAIRAGLPGADGIKNPANANTVFVADFTERAMQLCLDQ